MIFVVFFSIFNFFAIKTIWWPLSNFMKNLKLCTCDNHSSWFAYIVCMFPMYYIGIFLMFFFFALINLIKITITLSLLFHIALGGGGARWGGNYYIYIYLKILKYNFFRGQN
jgi:hypothetical protein